MARALLVVDVQKKFYTGTGKELIDRALPVVKKAVEAFRVANDVVIWIKHSDGRRLVEGKADFEILEELPPMKGEPVIVKRKGNGFRGTNLDAILKQRGITKVLVCGYAAEACVHQTFQEALKLNYEAWKLQGGIASSSKLLLSLFSRMGRYQDLRP